MSSSPSASSSISSARSINESRHSATQNLAPIMPFIEPIEPIELPSVSELKDSIDLSSSSSLLSSIHTTQTTMSMTTPAPTFPDHHHLSKDSNLTNNSNNWKGKATVPSTQTASNQALRDKHRRTTSEEEALIEKARMDLEQKISELNQLKNQLAQTEKRERELASRCVS